MQPAVTIASDLPTVSQTTAPAAASSRKADRWGYLEVFVLAQVLLPAILYLPGTQALRVPIRIAPFGISMLGFVFLFTARPGKPHPAKTLLILILLYLVAMIGSPGTNTPKAGFAQVMLYFSVMAPVFWAPALVCSKRQLQRIMAILLICNGINAVVGVLQVKFPAVFMPREFSTIQMNQEGGIGKYVGPNGEEIIRPPGLSDLPGAVCAPASVAALLGLIFALRPMPVWQRAGSALLAFAGVAAIFLSHVRTSILILGGMYVVYMILLLIQRDGRRAVTMLAAVVGLYAGALFFAALLGGEAVTDRFATLFEDDPTTVYYRSARGYQLQYDTQEYLSEFPLGAGLGRWGMMRLYFGNEDNPKSPPLWAELQWPAWALDGGFVLLLLYNIALIYNALHEFRLCRKLHRTSLAPYAAMIFASNAGVLALVFGFTPFTTQIGLQYWFLAGVLHGAAQLPGRELA